MPAPRMVYADRDGNIYDHPHLAMAGSSWGKPRPVSESEVIPLPEGSELFLLPRRLPLGYAPGGVEEVMEADPGRPRDPVTAVAAFMAPAHTATLWASYQTLPGAPALPLFAYAAVGYLKGQFVVTGVRTDPLPRQDAARFPPPERLAAEARKMLARFPNNRLVQHLGTCALTYGCPAAKNLMLGRWEAPLPTSRACNAACLGCLSSQPEGRFPATQERISFTPNPGEVAEVAMEHFRRRKDPLVSFGQGCEGEPLTEADLLEESIHIIRSQESRRTINLNTNGSLPLAVARLMRAGLSSIRVSLNSLDPERHKAYYRPRGWSLEDALESVRQVKKAGGHASLNLLTAPGLTDRPEEAEALEKLIESTGLDLIQWRNLNLDPEAYFELLGPLPPAEPLGIHHLITRLKRRFPDLKHGYFNPRLA